MMSRPPRTPKAGSSTVARVMGVAVADADAEEVADAEVEVGVIVEVTLSVVGTDVGT